MFMSEDAVHNPHDQLFKEAFGHIETAAVFFQSYLPADLRARLDWNSLQLQPGSYTDEALRGRESDLLYTVQIDRTSALLYCLFEHQSTPDAWMPLRLLRYILGIWEQYRKQNPTARKLPPVLPLVLFQGGAQWTADLSLSGLIDIPDGLASYQPEFRHLLVDLSHIKTEELQGTLIVRTILLALKASREGLHRELPRLFQFLAEMMVQQDVGTAMIRTLLRYICMVDNDTDLTEYMRQVEAIQQPKLQEEAMTIAEQLITKGRQEGGHREGRLAELREDIKDVLDERFGECSYTIIEDLTMVVDVTQLRALLRLAVRVQSVAAFQESLRASK